MPSILLAFHAFQLIHNDLTSIDGKVVKQGILHSRYSFTLEIFTIVFSDIKRSFVK